MAKGKYEYWLTEEGLTKLEGWARDGLTDEQIAKNIGISPKTLYRWEEKYCQICQSLKKGKEIVDIQVENALLKRALGYKSEEKTTENGKVVRTVTRDVPPDTTAQIFWLKNRRPDKWRDKQNIELSKPIDEISGEVEKILQEELEGENEFDVKDGTCLE